MSNPYESGREHFITEMFKDIEASLPGNDPVNNPSHYNQGAVETIDLILQVTEHYDGDVGYCIGNSLKYIARAPHKGKELEDLQKALWYLTRAISLYNINMTSNKKQPIKG